jgi:hypothetical protein
MLIAPARPVWFSSFAGTLAHMPAVEKAIERCAYGGAVLPATFPGLRRDGSMSEKRWLVHVVA